MEFSQTYITYIYIFLSRVEISFWTPYTCLAFSQKHIQNTFKHLRWNVFVCPVNDFKPLIACPKTLHLKCIKRCTYVCVQIASNNVSYHHNKRLMGYFKLLYDSGIICLPLNIPEKLHWPHLFEKPEDAETQRLYFS